MKVKLRPGAYVPERAHAADAGIDLRAREDGGGTGEDVGGRMVDEATGEILRWNDPRTAKIRSKTYEGISRAMAEQWGGSR